MRTSILFTSLVSLTVASCAVTADDADDDTGGDGKGDFAECEGTMVRDSGELAATLKELSFHPADTTICLSAGTFARYVTIVGGDQFSLRIVGAGRDKTRLSGGLSIDTNSLHTGWKNVSLEGVTIGGDTFGDGALRMEHVSTALTLRDSKTIGTLFAQTWPQEGPSSLTIIRTDLGTDYRGNSVFAWGDNSLMAVNLTNNIVRGEVAANASSPDDFTLDAINNTFLGETGVTVGDYAQATLTNNIFIQAGAVVVAQGNANVALDHNGFAECHLDTRGPVPALAANSPCRDAGNAARAPAADYLRTARDARPDLGAVEVH